MQGMAYIDNLGRGVRDEIRGHPCLDIRFGRFRWSVDFGKVDLLGPLIPEE
jgi:hypothetical protein